MMTIGRFLTGAALVLGLVQPLGAQTSGSLEPEDLVREAQAYINGRTALELDHRCTVFRSVEHLAVRERVWSERDALDLNNRAGGNWDVADAALAVLDDEARANADRLGCEGEGAALLARYLEFAMGMVFSDLLLAFHFASLPTSDDNHVALSPQDIEAAQRYDFYLQQRFGTNFPAFAERERGRATARLEEAATPQTYDPLLELGGLYDPFGYSWLFEEYDFGWGAFDDTYWLSRTAASTVATLVFEVAVESAGYRLAHRQIEGLDAVDIVNSADGSVRETLWQLWGAKYLYERNGWYYVTTLTPEGGLRVLTWTEGAAGWLGETPGVALLYNPDPMPAQFEFPFQYFNAPEWIDGATRIEAQRPTDCIGTVCFEFAPADVARMVETSSTNVTELIIGQQPDAGPSKPDQYGSRPNTFYIDGLSGYLAKVTSRN